MSKKLVFLMFLVIILTGLLVASTNVTKVEAQLGTIYIRADGSIDPPTANITRTDNVTYTFTDNINASIVVQRSNIVINGNGYTLNGSWSLMYGFNLTSISNVAIKNVNVVGFGYGIYLQSSILNILSENNITFNEGNIYLGNSSDNTIAGNTMTDGAEAIQLYASSNNTISGNSMNNNSIGVWSRLNSAENVISGNNITANTNDGIYLDSSYGNSISENEINNNHNGIRIYASSNNEIIGNNLMANDGGIALGGDNNTLYKNSIQAKYIGIDIFGSYNIITQNNITNCDTGFFFGWDTVYNTVSDNNIKNNVYGLYFEHALNHSIVGNYIVNNTYSVYLDWYSLNMRIYHNTFSNNTNHMYVSNPSNPNFLDNGVEGNYWNNYTGIDLNHDGIGDTPHVIDANNTDYYPLMGMFHSLNTSLGKYVNVISNSTIDSFRYFESNSTIRMHVSNVTSNQMHGFCRISIPYAVMSEPFNVTINGVNPTYWNYTLYDNGSHRWIYFEYEHTTQEIVIIPEFPSFLILPLFMIATLLAVIVYRRKHSIVAS